MKKVVRMIYNMIILILLFSTALSGIGAHAVVTAQTTFPDIAVDAIDGLPEDFILGADISSLLSLEASGRVFYGFNGREQDLLKTLAESGVNTVRVRVWNDPFDKNGGGYGGGNCTVDTAIALGKRAAAYGMGLLVDLHYSDFWADPGKQQAPKAWQSMSYEDKSAAVGDYTADSIRRIEASGVRIDMIQVGNETTTGFCGETDKAARYGLMRTAAQAVRDTDPAIRIVTHFTDPEHMQHAEFARDLKTYSVDYDIFATSYYPAFHGTIDNLKEQLKAAHEIDGKQVMIAETSWAHTSDKIGAYRHSVQGQADEIADCVQAMTELGDYAIGVMYWEPAWIDVPGDSETQRSEKREAYGAGWASSYSVEYDPDDAGRYYGATACIPDALFDEDGYPLPSLRTFAYLREGSGYDTDNRVIDPSFEDAQHPMWQITEKAAGTVGFSDDPGDARDGSGSLHFWNAEPVEFTAEQTISDLDNGSYTLSLSAQGGDIGENAELYLYAVSGGERREQRFTIDGWRDWKAVTLEHIPCTDGRMTVGVAVKAAAGAWGTIDCFELVREPENGEIFRLGDADNNNEVEIIDATVIQRSMALIHVAVFNGEAADVDRDGEVSAVDVTLIQRWLNIPDARYRIGEFTSSPRQGG